MTTCLYCDEFGPEKIIEVYCPKTGMKGVLVIDNTFAGPFCCNPFALGPKLDELLVLNSTTKNINGFSCGLGGVIVFPWKYWKQIFLFRFPETFRTGNRKSIITKTLQRTEKSATSLLA